MPLHLNLDDRMVALLKSMSDLPETPCDNNSFSELHNALFDDSGNTTNIFWHRAKKIALIISGTNDINSQEKYDTQYGKKTPMGLANLIYQEMFEMKT